MWSYILITIRSDDGFPLEPLLAEWDDIGALTERGVGFLVHSLLNQLVDGYFEVLDDLDERIQSLEDELLEGTGPTRDIQLRSFALRKDVVQLSRVVLTMKEALSALLRPGVHAAWAAIIAIPTGVTGYFGQYIPFPGYAEPWGFRLSAVMLVGFASGLWVRFKRRGWLWRAPRARKARKPLELLMLVSKSGGSGAHPLQRTRAA